MLRRDWRRIIFVSSEAGAEVHPDTIHYGVTKTGQLVVARGLAEMTNGTRVTVNSVLPGPTRSEAIVEFLQSLASTPGATPEQAEKEFFERHRPTSLIQRMAEDSEVPAWSRISPARSPPRPTARRSALRVASCVSSSPSLAARLNVI